MAKDRESILPDRTVGFAASHLTCSVLDSGSDLPPDMPIFWSVASSESAHGGFDSDTTASGENWRPPPSYVFVFAGDPEKIQYM
jgi:hypothetical protein